MQETVFLAVAAPLRFPSPLPASPSYLPLLSHPRRCTSQLRSLRDYIVSGKVRFQGVASRYSDCSSAKRGDDLGLFADIFL
ncbi:hypothetical protein J5N97_022022 [Dioscorea zingiberensis]|uniref:Peptidyl-prolyl cis-trans isomerase n=1 Tax=Dioscorea zingiberensis TaxID=325984 RepID=A0A9D5CB36_9LILI|nr:hypothetical protein J5N97_022022 [Dioscorea zingiberensis]